MPDKTVFRPYTVFDGATFPHFRARAFASEARARAAALRLCPPAQRRGVWVRDRRFWDLLGYAFEGRWFGLKEHQEHTAALNTMVNERIVKPWQAAMRQAATPRRRKRKRGARGRRR